MQRFGVLNFMSWVVEIIGWIILALGFLYTLIVLMGGAALAAAGQMEAGLMAGMVFLAGALSPILVRLVTIVLGQTLRVLVVIAKSTQETSLYLDDLRHRAQAFRDPDPGGKP